jgi:hypothetical protein
MGNGTEKVTKLHLQAFGLSDYVIKQLVKGLDAASTNGGRKEYFASDIKASVEKRLKNHKVRAANQAKLQRVLTCLNGESNIIQVDFLKGLSPEKKIEVLRARIQELEVQEQGLTEETEQLLTQARRMVASK